MNTNDALSWLERMKYELKLASSENPNRGTVKGGCWEIREYGKERGRKEERNKEFGKENKRVGERKREVDVNCLGSWAEGQVGWGR